MLVHTQKAKEKADADVIGLNSKLETVKDELKKKQSYGKAANDRFLPMTGNQYQLFRQEETTSEQSKTLLDLSNSNKLVGIISHREELMQIPQQIRVEKTKDGSSFSVQFS